MKHFFIFTKANLCYKYYIMENLTPMLKQYQDIKAQYQDCILFFRLGDFYEMFYDDARIASKILDVVLTSRGTTKTGRIPMCGIPYHAKETYLTKIIKAGLKVAICEQVEDPALAKGIVKRKIIKVITPGTFIDENNSEPRYLLSVTLDNKFIGIAFSDTNSGQIQTNQYPHKNRVIEIITKLPVYESIFPVYAEERIKDFFKHPLVKMKHINLTPCDDWCFNPDIAKKGLCEHFQTQSLKGFGIEDMPLAISSAGALLEYLKQMHCMPLKHIDKISLYLDTDYVFISSAACYGLDLEELFKTIDRTFTAFGKRCLKNWLYHPLKTKEAILKRQETVTLLKENPRTQQELNTLLKNIPDIEKSLSRISCAEASAKDLVALRNTLNRLPEIAKVLMPIVGKNSFFSLDDLPEIRKLLTDAINSDIPLAHPEGKIIANGYHKELDSLRDIQENARVWLKNLQAQEIKKTGINSLKIGYTQVFGYYIEITKANLHLVPADYIRKQTLVNAERFVTPELKELEEKMLNAEENILKIEKQLLEDIQRQILDNSSCIHEVTQKLANLDALNSLSQLASSPGYIAPQINQDLEINIKDGRHPVVERYLEHSFIPNDTLLDCQKHHLNIITGPNMSGKSTFIRQTAILVIMAQIGSYIPAASAKIGIVDKIFTRIGAHDEITKGQSTFMVEMSEAAEILNNLSERSLLILDEIGRGTSTYDGLSLAWAIAEYLQKQKVRTLFATHFHELTALQKEYPGVQNYNVAVKEWNNEVVFLHKILPGSCDDSYGIYVAKLAGIPQEVILQASQILERLELNGRLHDKICNRTTVEENQTGSPEDKSDAILKEIKTEIGKIAIDSLTPVSALNKINEWKDRIKDGKSTCFTCGDNQ